MPSCFGANLGLVQIQGGHVRVMRPELVCLIWSDLTPGLTALVNVNKVLRKERREMHNEDYTWSP
jgi:hypothetical protein